MQAGPEAVGLPARPADAMSMTTPEHSTAERALVREELRRPFTLGGKIRLAVEIVDTYIRVRVWLMRMDLPAVVVATRAVGNPVLAEVDLRQQAVGYRLGRVVGRTLSKLPADSRCLVRSLVLSRLLARRGIPAKLVIGVRLEPTFEAHAWVESGGIPLLPPEEMTGGRLLEL
jgi:Transglutaminase-like superfamily